MDIYEGDFVEISWECSWSLEISQATIIRRTVKAFLSDGIAVKNEAAFTYLREYTCVKDIINGGVNK